MFSNSSSNVASASHSSDDTLNPPSVNRFGRRRLLIAAAAGVVPLAAARLATTRPAAAAFQNEATPVASPEAAATPAAGETIGQLQVVRDPRPVYDGAPVETDEIRLLLTAGDNADYSPASYRQDFQILASHLDPLVWIDEVTMEPLPWLAESWEITDGGETITFQLRDGIRWQDGERLHARDVAFSFLVYRDDLDSAVRNFFTNMASAEAVDAATVRVTLTAPDGNWLLNASSQFIIQRKQYIDHWSENPEGQRTLSGFNWSRNAPIGTGPWKVGRRGEQSIELNRNDEYWAGPANAKKLILTWDPDPAARLDAWKTGATDLLWPVRGSTVAAASDSPGRLHVADGASVMFAAFNVDNPERNPPDFLRDLNLRRGLSLAIDRQRYAAGVFGGFIRADRAGTVAQPWANDPASLNPPRDVEPARELLRAGGYEAPSPGAPIVNTDGNPLDLSIIVRNDARPELLELLQYVVEDFAEVGVGLRIRTISPERFFIVWTEERSYDLIAYAYNLFPGFTDFDLYGSNWDIRRNPQGWNPGAYSNEIADRAIRDILAARDYDEQREPLIQLQQAVNDDLFGLWFGFPQELTLVRPDILGFQPNINWQTWDTRKLWRQPR